MVGIICRYSYAVILLVGAVVLSSCGDGLSEPDGGNFILSGGATTILNANSNAFSTPAPNLSGSQLDLHAKGDAEFESKFVAAPAEVYGGLGPVFNSNSCVSCHVRDGRGRPPFVGEEASQMLMRISLPGSDPITGEPLPVPGYGTQLFDKSIFGKRPQGKFRVDWAEISGTYGDGTSYTLRKPLYAITDAYRPMPSNMLYSPRVAPPVFGGGLLEAIPESAILANADPSDANGDGISGKANYVWNVEQSSKSVGRFGWKANTPTLLQQTAAAYRNDMGITSPYFPVESAFGSEQDDGHGDDPEISMKTLEAVTFYVQTLAVPARRNVRDETVRRGEVLFANLGCASCHVPSFQTGVLTNVPEVSNQRIYPYTDLLLHDVGEELADRRPDFDADGREWRTPPLWGIGLTSIVNGHTFFLHDGRARSLAEAILWHGGEAEAAREGFRTIAKEDREALITFLESL
ncbi:MAG: thiol oxidoreductase [Ignavibacteriae bacterium]|nr:thiol oxidoreductase [Ignavibacteriota bacterium]MCB9214247.1 thiol oxidoreductase [Ignavibacteria bacterium]